MKRSIGKIALSGFVVALVSTTGAPVSAQDAASAPGAEAPATGDADEERFRFGVAAGAGIMSWEGPTLTYGGVDLRFGLQVNDMIGVYAQPQVGAYSLDVGGGASGTGGLLGGSGVVDFTFMDQLFVGGGLGYAILNSPSGLELHFRAGGTPSPAAERTSRAAGD